MKGKKILLCVSGGIAAYKAAALTSKLVQEGCDVRVAMSGSAIRFIAPLTFQALSRNEVYTDTFVEKDPKVIAHIDAADWADLVLVAPATANIIGKLANGIADDMVTTTILASRAPVWLAPAMNVNMYDHPSVKRNIETLKGDGVRFIEPAEGYLACGWVGKGRLEEPERVMELVREFFTVQPSLLKGKTVLITAGPTKERIDPVRYFTNRSSGKMGYALAEAAIQMGAKVILVSGADSLPVPHGVEFVPAESAEDMYQRVMEHFGQADIIIMSAAVADYRPKETYDKKLKKQEGNLVIEFERTKDILYELGKIKKGQFLAGFAAETNHVEEYAKGKLEKKNVDMIVANDVTREGAGFAGDTNIVTIFNRDQSKKELPLMSKKEAAVEILKEIAKKLGEDGKA
ncbi:MAG TPA: bifunctional phosphopantothenoylcysteine decarboxylase/phosphopantothenate--cysteine ligase CoaBC [Bacillaceae bacterium]